MVRTGAEQGRSGSDQGWIRVGSGSEHGGIKVSDHGQIMVRSWSEQG